MKCDPICVWCSHSSIAQFYAVFSNGTQRLLNNNNNNSTQIITLKVTQIRKTPVTGENQKQYKCLKFI